MEQWLTHNNFSLDVDHRFTFIADWGAVECRVLAVEPNKTLSYTWAAHGLESVVTWTLTPTSTGTHLSMEQSGFRTDSSTRTTTRRAIGIGSVRTWNRYWSEYERGHQANHFPRGSFRTLDVEGSCPAETGVEMKRVEKGGSKHLKQYLPVLALQCVLWIGACRSVTPDSARVYFKTDAPFCGRLVIEKLIDGVVLGRDTVSSDQTSIPYLVTPGTHVVGARAVFFSGPIPFPDTTVMLAAGASVTRVLPFYCS